MVICLRLTELTETLLRLPVEQPHHIRKMPNVVSGIGALRDEESPSARTRRVSSGSMMPSSQSRAVEEYGLPVRSYFARISAGSVFPTINRTVAACSPPI